MFCGIDWAERHHDIALIGQDGALIAKRRINDGPEGFDELTAMLTAAGDSVEDPIPVAIETPRGLLVAACARPPGRCLRSTRWQLPDTVSVTRSRGRSPTTPMR